MTDSAVFVGGLPALISTLVLALILLAVMPPDLNGMRWRVPGFFVLWQTFTPVMPWYLDIPLWFLALLAMELLYRALMFGKRA